MKKKCLLRIILAVILTITIAGIVLYSKNIKNFNLFQNRKNAINEKNTSSTTIDVTYLEDNGNLDHEHIFKTMYDENKHWEECTVCGEKNNESNHSYTDKGWTMGNANNCHKNNIHEFVCSCGYSKSETIGKKEHVWSAVNVEAAYDYREICYNCNWSIMRNKHRCININNGKLITCMNLGRCSICNYNYTNAEHIAEQQYQKDDNIYCSTCNTYLGVVNDVYTVNQTDGKFTCYTRITVPTGASFIGMSSYPYDNNVQLSNSHKINGNVWENEQTGIYNLHSEVHSPARTDYRFYLNGVKSYILIDIIVSAENTAPTISKINNQNEESLSEWSRIKPIIVSGTENYCNTVTVEIKDDKENIVFKGKGAVSNNNYEVQCIPEVECDINGRTFTVTVTDSLENSTSQEFTISKVDCIPPTPTSDTEILGDWAKSKDFTFTATDYGIGQVQIAFNDVSDMKLAKVDEHTYSRDYTFTGDVYHEKELSVLYKDGLGNTSIQKIKIDKLDNTAPTITNTELHNNKITISSHDRHETFGEGSGVVKYRYLASEEKLTNPELTSENSTESANAEIIIKDIYKMKYIYIVAEDYVGNISKVYEFEVPQLILTSTVNLNTADGKGEIILDWSTYDVTDKYFVVYRKQDNQTEWDTIVPLTQKLTGDTYTDKLGNDKAKPDAPNITITGDNKNNNIKVEATSNDNGTKYIYYIEAYDSTDTNILLSKSN